MSSTTTTATDSSDGDIETWKDVHRHLTLAIIQSRDNVAEALAKRRYLLEEINRSSTGGQLPAVSSQGKKSAAKSNTKQKKASAGQFIDKKKIYRKCLPNNNLLPSNSKVGVNPAMPSTETVVSSANNNLLPSNSKLNPAVSATETAASSEPQSKSD